MQVTINFIYISDDLVTAMLKVFLFWFSYNVFSEHWNKPDLARQQVSSLEPMSWLENQLLLLW